MDRDVAVQTLGMHAASLENGVSCKKGFLGALRPFQGTLNEQNFIEIMECLKALADELASEKIENTLIAHITTITYLPRRWLSKGGMLERNKLLTTEQSETLSLWLHLIENAYYYLLFGDKESAFAEYEEYLSEAENEL